MPLTGQPTKEFALQPITNDTLVCFNKNKTSERRPTIQSIQVETEELIYPWQSFLAEFGGALGLFLGFSFMTIWDSLHSVVGFTVSAVK